MRSDVAMERVRSGADSTAAGEKPRKAYLSAMAAVLASKNFYFLEEGSATERRDRVTDNELASRLSYFLWSSLPDEPLFAAARGGKLHERAVLAEQFSRMQSDPKFDRFMKEFPRQWLQLLRRDGGREQRRLHDERAHERGWHA
jgi:hypothetical protein